jgi:ATP-dependent protease Clp ATPase subunit
LFFNRLPAKAVYNILMLTGLSWPYSEHRRTVHWPKSRKTRLSVVHNVLLVGPPGAGKTLLAHSIPSILPRMTIEDALDMTRIYSVANQIVEWVGNPFQ